MMEAGKCWIRLDTEYSACSVEVVTSDQWGSLAAVGLYQLEEGSGARLGRILLLSLTLEGGDAGPTCREVDRVQQCPAVLDMKWWTSGRNCRLAVADAAGDLTLYRLDSAACRLERQVSLNLTPGLTLALDWTLDGKELVVSDSNGKVHLVRVGESDLTATTTLAAHSHEAWTCCWDRGQGGPLVYSGGGDCVLCLWDGRVGERPVQRNSKTHQAGVTAVQCDTLLRSGSYDEQVRVWEPRQLRSELHTTAVGGGVWRIRQSGEHTLVAAMHDGFKLVRAGRVEAEYRGHASLAYGADWTGLQLEREGQRHHLLATSSFYDHLFTLWTVPAT